MITRFHNLFRVMVSHTFYLDRKCPDLEVWPSQRTRRKLSNYGLLFRQELNGCKVAFEAEDDQRTPRVEISGEVVFTFGLKLQNPYFYNFTELPALNEEEVYYYNNLSGEAMSAGSIVLKPSWFNYYYEAGKKNITLILKDAFGNTVYENAHNKEDKKFNLEIDARSWKPGVYNLEIKEGNTTKDTDRFYISDELLSAGCFGIVDIYQLGGVNFDYNTPTDFSISFNTKKKPWKYHIEFTRDYSSHTLIIEDTEDYTIPQEEPNYPYDSELKFMETGSSTQKKGAIATFVTGTSPGNEMDVPLSELPKRKIQLTVSNGSNQFTIKNLPNPELSNSRYEVYLKI